MIRPKFDANGWESSKEFIHFALTSQDINNTAIPLSLKEYVNSSFLPLLTTLVDALKARAHEWKDVTLLARTHGQPATPTLVGKEISTIVIPPPYLFIYKIDERINMGVC